MSTVAVTDTPTTGLISWKDSLTVIPLRNHAAAVHISDKGRVQLRVPRTLPRFMVPPLTWVVAPRREKSFELDAVGSELWRACDGTSTVEDIADWFADRHKLTFHEARIAVNNYLKLLVERGGMVLAQPECPEDERGRGDAA